MPVLIDPRTRSITSVEIEPAESQIVHTIDADTVLHLSPTANDRTFIFEGLPGVHVGSGLVVGTMPLAAVKRRVRWVRALMVLNGITSIVA